MESFINKGIQNFTDKDKYFKRKNWSFNKLKYLKPYR